MDKPLHLTKSDQENKESMTVAMERNATNGYKEVSQSETEEKVELVLPENCLNWIEPSLPTECRSHFFAELHCAYEHFEEDWFAPCCVCTVFHDRLFTLLFYGESVDLILLTLFKADTDNLKC